MTSEQIKDNIRALKLLRRSYKAKKPFAYGLKACPLCSMFMAGAGGGCTNCVWRKMDKHDRVWACESTFLAIDNFYDLKAKTAPHATMKLRLDHLEVQLQWLEEQKGKK